MYEAEMEIISGLKYSVMYYSNERSNIYYVYPGIISQKDWNPLHNIDSQTNLYAFGEYWDALYNLLHVVLDCNGH